MTHDAHEPERTSVAHNDPRHVSEPGIGLSSRSDRLDSEHAQTGRVLLSEDHLRIRRRRTLVPIVLFLLTCASTFWAGATHWRLGGIGGYGTIFSAIHENLWNGLIYMACVLAILFAHEMGHFIATVIHRIPASLPFFIPFPISPIGTMGAVIAMDGRRADRREVFDIGISGPIAGLVLAIPILIYGVWQLDFQRAYFGPAYDSPLLVDILVAVIHGDASSYRGSITQSQLNPFYMAGWVGLLITGVNMMPVSQLDGGHVIYTLFGKSALWVARGFIFVAILFVVFGGALNWLFMLILVILMGTDHPPTRNDNISLGTFRTVIGFGSLAIPVLCFPTQLFIM